MAEEEKFRKRSGGVVSSKELGINNSKANKDNYAARFTKPSYQKGLSSSTNKAPQAIVKVASHAKGANVKNVLNYVSRDHKEEKEKLSLEDENGVKITGKEEIDKVYAEWKKDFERRKAGSKRDVRHATHIIFSAKGQSEKHDLAKVTSAARAVLSEQFGKAGYNYMFVAHGDSDKPHVHAVVKAFNNETGKKLRIGKPELFMLREKLAEELTKNGLAHGSSLRKDRPEFVAALAKGEKPPLSSWKESKYQKIDKESASARLILSKAVDEAAKGASPKDAKFYELLTKSLTHPNPNTYKTTLKMVSTGLGLEAKKLNNSIARQAEKSQASIARSKAASKRMEEQLNKRLDMAIKVAEFAGRNGGDKVASLVAKRSLEKLKHQLPGNTKEVSRER